MRKLLSFVLALAMVASLVPAPALAEAADELEVVTQGEAGEAVLPEEDATVQEPALETLEVQDAEQDDADVTTQANLEDRFFIQDYETGKRVTTLHTSRTYVLVNPDGTPYTDDDYVYFECVGTNARGQDESYAVSPKIVYDDDYETTMVVLEGLGSYDYSSSFGWLPTGLYRIAFGSYSSSYHSGNSYLTKRYNVVNDGMFAPKFDFSYGSGTQNYYQFSVKPFEEGKTDDEYDEWYYDEDDDWEYKQRTPDQEPFVLGSDTRIKFEIESATPMDDANKPELLSIGLWKADESLEVLTGDKYYEADAQSFSRVPELLAQGGLEALPTFPNAINFADDSKVTSLLERGDANASLGERVVLGDPTTANVIVDHANFANASVADGMYFPMVTIALQDETYTFAYYPIQVTANDPQPRDDPRITTATLKDARVGDAYTATLKGKSGAAQAGDLTWSVSAGELPAGLVLDAQTGAISGMPTQAGTKTFRVTLTETIDDEQRSATRELTINVREQATSTNAFEKLTLGEIGYRHGVMWLSSIYSQATYLNLHIPISLDIRDERYDLGQTELWYALQLETGDDRDGHYWVWHGLATDYLNEDGTMLEVPAELKTENSLISNTKALRRVCAFLIPKTNTGELAFDPGPLLDDTAYSDGTSNGVMPIEHTLTFRYGSADGEQAVPSNFHFMHDDGDGFDTHMYGGAYAHYDLPQMPHTALDNPDVSLGGWVRFPSLDFGIDDEQDWPTTKGRVRLWAYDGTTNPTTQHIKTITRNPYYYLSHTSSSYKGAEEAASAIFKLAPGTYACVIEGEVPVFDEDGSQVEGEATWVDIAGGIEGAQVVPGTAPRQFLITVEPNGGMDEGSSLPTALNVTYTSEYMEDVHRHTLNPLFELEEEGQFVSELQTPNRRVEYTTSWYRRTGANESSDVLVATGNNVMFGASDYDLYVEVAPKGRDAAFWKSTGKVKVSQNNRSIEIKVHRKQLFSGTFHLSCELGNEPEAGQHWGIIEVQTPVSTYGYTSSNIWATARTVRVPGLTSGSIVTFTPRTDLYADSVSYEVPEDATTDFTQNLVAPEAKGSITFEGLSFTDVEGQTTPFSLTDGLTGVIAKRVETMSDGTEYLYDAPFMVAEGNRIVLQPSYAYGSLPFVHSDAEVTYRVTVTHRDVAEQERMGVTASDHAAKKSFDVALSQSKTSATVAPATFLSRGYAVVPLDNINGKLSTLLLYDGEGQLVDKGPAGTASRLRTPFLDADTYTLYLVDSNRITRYASIDTIQKLQDNVLTGLYANHGTSLEFEVEDGKVNVLGEGFAHSSWADTDVIDKNNSTVSIATNYKDSVSVQMHAQLAKNATVNKDAYLEVVTNQASRQWGEGYMNPKALTINGKTLTLNRWDNLLNQTQCMGDGSLTILLAEARKIDASCAEFPMDLTLVIPCTNRSHVEASVWLVTKDGSTTIRSLVGTAIKELHEASITVPPVVAWQDFYVYGETAPNANVSVYLNGMRTSTARSDSYGYYSAQITLPDDVQEFEEFTLSASAQWLSGEAAQSATSDSKTTMYSTLVPAVEKITMFYQSEPYGPYNDVVCYDRGRQPNRYLTLYRSEHDNRNTSGKHAEYFWMAEFANGDNVADVQFKIPRSASTTSLTSTDVLATAESWIPDVQTITTYYGAQDTQGWTHAKTGAGQVVRDALTSTGARTHAFVTQPAYFTSSPSNMEVSFDVNDDNITIPMAGYMDQRQFQPLTGGVSQDEKDGLSLFMDAMGKSGSVRVISGATAAGLGLNQTVLWENVDTTDDMAQGIIDASGNIDEWILLGTSTNPDDAVSQNHLLKVHHQVVKTNLTLAALQQEVQEVTDEAQRVIDPFESWVYDDGPLPTGTKERYKGNYVANAVGTRTTQNESYLHCICTVDDNGNSQLETFEKFFVDAEEAVDTYLYKLTRSDGRSMTITTWDEQNRQRVDVTYTIAPDQQDDSWTLDDVLTQWSVLMESIVEAMDAGGAYVTGDVETQADDEGIAVGTQAPGDPHTEIGGMVGGYVTSKAQDHVARKLLDIPEDSVFAHMLKDAREFNDMTKEENQNRVSSQGNNKEGMRRAITTTKTGGKIVTYKAASAGVSAATSASPIKDFVYGMVASSVGESDWVRNTAGALYDGTIADPKKQANWRTMNYFLYSMYRSQKNRSAQGKINYLWLFRYGMRRETVNILWKKYQQDDLAWMNFNGPLNRVTHDPSGIVYEAVLSNPVEGATVQLYTYNDSAAKAGLDAATFIDSTEFGIEENPQVTAADGRYQWFVPEGYWQVRVSKKGYENFSTGDWGHEEERPVYEEVQRDDGTTEWVQATNADGTPKTQKVLVGDYGVDATKDFNGDGEDDADSYWMPVLPVQLDVNIPLVSLEAPVVTSAEAFADGVVVTFSKYMKVDTVTKGLFAINAKVPAAIEATDAEEAADGSGVMLARSFKLAYPAGEEPKAGDNTYNVAFVDAKGAATSYAGVAADVEGRDLELPCSVEVPAISLADAAIASIPAQTYTGKALKPSVTVTYGSAKLRKGTDYAVSYANNVNAGTATVTVTGRGGYAGTIQTTFKIGKGTQTITVPSASVECVTGKTAKLGAKASGGGKLSYKSSAAKVATVSAKGVVTGKKAGTAKVTITAAATANWKKATRVVTVKVGKANPVSAKAAKKVVAVAYGKVKSKAQATAANVRVTKAQGAVTFSNASTNATAKKFKVDAKTGKVTVPKGTRKGKYAVKVAATAAGNKSYVSGTKTVAYTIQVK